MRYVRSDRMFEIIQLLRGAAQPVTAHELAEALEVVPRTIYRDIAALQAMRVPIEGEAGIGYVMRAGFDLPPLMFTTEEVEAIVVGLALLRRTGDLGLQSAAIASAPRSPRCCPAGSTVLPICPSMCRLVGRGGIEAGRSAPAAPRHPRGRETAAHL